MRLRLSAGRGCSAQTDVPFLNWRLNAEGRTGFFIARIPQERECDVKLRFGVPRETTAVSVSFGFQPSFCLALPRSPAASEGRRLVPRGQEDAAEGGESLVASVQGIRFIRVTNVS